MTPTRHHWTPAETERREHIRAQGCIYCRLAQVRGLQPTGMAVEIHHVTDCGRQIGNGAILPACSWHHRAICREGMTSSAMANLFGPSLAKGSKPFRAFFGSDAELLAITDRRAA